MDGSEAMLIYHFLQEIARIAMDMSGALESVVNRLKNYQAEMQGYKPKIDELEGYHQVIVMNIK